jgi:hypothetical protein
MGVIMNRLDSPRISQPTVTATLALDHHLVAAVRAMSTRSSGQGSGRRNKFERLSPDRLAPGRGRIVGSPTAAMAAAVERGV